MKSINTIFCVALFAVAAPAAAQIPAASDTNHVVMLPGLDVRASRSAVPTARLPFPVISSDVSAASSHHATSADAALRGIAGVQAVNRFNDAVGERVTIRGLGARAQFGIRGIRVMVDGIPATMPDGQTTLTHLDAGSVTRAEVLRGPAGALWGNASGGVVSLQTAPSPDQVAGARFDVDGNNLVRGSASALAMQSSGDVWARATIQHYGGFRDYAASDKTLFSLGGHTNFAAGNAWAVVHAVDYDAQNPGSLTQRQLDSARFQANPGNVRMQTGERGRHAEVGAGWERAVRSGTIEVSAWGAHRSLANPIPPSIIDLTRNAGGLRGVFVSSTSSVTWSAGVEGGVQSDARENYANSQGARGALTLDQDERVTYAAPFAQVVVSVLDSLDIMSALRYDRYSFRANDHLINAGNPDDSGRRSMDAPSFTAGVRMRAHPFSAYANYSTSFQTPTTTELANRPDGAGGFNPLLDPERTRAAEAGASWEGGMLRLDGALWIARVRDALIPFEVESAPGRQFFRNAGSVRNRGVDVTALLRPVDGISLRGAWSRIDARFDSYPAAGTSLDGLRVPGVAGSVADGSVTFSPRRFDVVTSVRHSGTVVANDANTASAPAWTTIDASLTTPPFRAGRMTARATLGIDNIADTDYVTSVSINAAGSRYFEPGPGRSVSVSISAGIRGGR